MNIKRLLAFTLAGTLSLSNISWAGISGPEREMVSRETRSPGKWIGRRFSVEAPMRSG